MSLIWKVWLPLLCWDLNSPPKNSIPLIFKCFRFVHFSLVIELISIAKTFPWPIPPTKAKKRMKQWAWNGSLKWFHSLFANFLQLIEFEQFHLPSLEQKSDLVFYCFGLGFTHGQFWSSLGFIQPWFRQCPLGATFSMYTQCNWSLRLPLPNLWQRSKGISRVPKGVRRGPWRFSRER